MNHTSPNSAGSSNMGGGGGGTLLIVALFAVSCFILYKTFFTDQPNFFSNLIQSPTAVQVTYRPAEFKTDILDEDALAILANPEKYRKQFDGLVYEFNTALLLHLSRRMGLHDTIHQRLLPEYMKHHAYISEMFYQDFVQIKDPSAINHETWYANNMQSAVRAFNEVAGKYTCFFITQILGTLIQMDGGVLMAKGKKIETPCGIALQEGLKPMVDRLTEKAAVQDFSRSRGFLKEKVSKGIAELATYEIQSRKGINKQLQYKIFGFAVSTTDIEISAISTIKAGFKLDRYFDITLNPSKGIVFVTLPEPIILSHEVHPRVDNLDVGWLSGIKSEEMNSNMNLLRREFRDEAIQKDDIYGNAKIRADSIMSLMLEPAVRSINPRYRVQVRFQSNDASNPTQPNPGAPQIPVSATRQGLKQ